MLKEVRVPWYQGRQLCRVMARNGTWGCPIDRDLHRYIQDTSWVYGEENSISKNPFKLGCWVHWSSWLR